MRGNFVGNVFHSGFVVIQSFHFVFLRGNFTARQYTISGCASLQDFDLSFAKFMLRLGKIQGQARKFCNV